MKTDLSYKKDGFVTRFYPESKDGEVAWRQMAAQNGGSTTIYSAHLDQTLAQLRAAGYCVRKQKATKATDKDDDKLLAELFG